MVAAATDLDLPGQLMTIRADPSRGMNGRFTDTFAAEGYDAHVYEIKPR